MYLINEMMEKKKKQQDFYFLSLSLELELEPERWTSTQSRAHRCSTFRIYILFRVSLSVNFRGVIGETILLLLSNTPQSLHSWLTAARRWPPIASAKKKKGGV